MSHVQVYDRALCCNTGVCGPQVDPELPQFASDLEWLKQQGHQVNRFNLAHDPARFAENAAVQKHLQQDGVECLPLLLVDGQVVSQGHYPTRDNLALWTKSQQDAKPSLPVADLGCCDRSEGC